MAALLLSAAGWAGPLVAPEIGEPSPGDCAQATALEVGGVVPPSLINLEGTAACSAVALPPSDVAYLLKLEEYCGATERLHALDVDLLKAERDWYRDRLATQLEPKPWYERPGAQRWVGRVEMLIVVGIATAGVSYAYGGR